MLVFLSALFYFVSCRIEFEDEILRCTSYVSRAALDRRRCRKEPDGIQLDDDDEHFACNDDRGEEIGEM